MKSLSKMILLALAVALLVAIPAQADWHTATVATGNEVTGMAVDPVRNRIFTANNVSGINGTVSVIDGRTDEVQTWVAGAQPTCLAFNPVTGKLYVSINGSATNDTVVVFDTTGTIIKKLPVKKDPSSMVLDMDNDRLYVANYGSDTISIFASDTLWFSYPVRHAPMALTLNPVNHALFIRYASSDTFSTLNPGQYSIMHLRNGTGVQDIIVNAAANLAYVSNFNTSEVSVYDCSGIMPSFLKSISVTTPTSLVSDPGAKRVYVVSSARTMVTAIDCSTNTAVSSVAVGPNTSSLAMNPVTGKLYVCNNQTYNALRIIDWRNGGTKDSVILSRPPALVAINPVTNKIYTAYYNSGTSDSLAVIDGSDFDTTIVAAKTNTYGVAVNLITGDAYATNSGSNNVTVIKANGDTLTIGVGANPQGLAVNPLTNKIFVCNFAGKSVSVIDGASYAVERTITVDTLPNVIAVNPLTNFIYVNSFLASANRVKVIDGKDWDTTSVQVGSKPFSIAINPATNRIYVGNDASGTVTVIDGAHHMVITSVSVNRPYKIDINPVTNKIYVAKLQTSGQVSVIDGATNVATNVAVGNWPSGIAVNRANNKIYVTNYNDSTVTEIDGVTNATATIKAGVHPEWIAADPVTGKVFVSNSGGSSLSIIDCASRSVKTMTVPTGPRQVAVNPVTGKVYLACYTAGRAVVIDQTVEQDTKVNVEDPQSAPWDKMLPGATHNRAGYSYNHWSPYKTKIKNAMFSLATSQSFWKFAYNFSSTDSSLYWSTQNYLWGADSAFYGENIYRCYSLETQGASTNNLGIGTPFAGNVLNRMLYRIDYASPAIAWWDSLADDNNPADGYGPYTVRAVITDFSGIDTANMYYELNSVSMPRVRLTRGTADTFSAVIPAVTVPAESTKTIVYNLHAWDHAQNPYGIANYGSTSARYFYLRNLTGVAGNPSDPALPNVFALQEAYPNPSAGRTVIRYQLPQAAEVNLTVYNVAGQMVKSFNEGQKPAGYHQISWNDGKLSNGIYFYKLKAGQFIATRKMVVLK